VRTDLVLREYPITKSKTRILRPSEYLIIKENVKKRDKQILMDSLLLTGMRYEELIRFRQNPEWLDREFIHLPEWAQKKAKRKQKERTVKLSIMGRSIIPQLFEISVPPRTTFDKWLKYNFPLIQGLSAKTFRKTWESWLIFYYGDSTFSIASSQGHDELTELRYYVNLPFREEDRIGMRPFVEGWK